MLESWCLRALVWLNLVLGSWSPGACAHINKSPGPPCKGKIRFFVLSWVLPWSLAYDPSLGLCEIVIKHLLGCALEFNWIPILLVAVNCCPWLEENYLAIGLQLL